MMIRKNIWATLLRKADFISISPKFSGRQLSKRETSHSFHSIPKSLCNSSLIRSYYMAGVRNKMKRSGAGTVLLVGFVIAVTILSIAAYMAPPEIKVEENVHEEFIDTLSYMISVIEVASKLPGTAEEKADFINKSLSHLRNELSTKGIGLWYQNVTIPLISGQGDNVVIIYTLEKGDTYFAGLLATNLTDIQKGIGSGRGGPGGGVPGGGGSDYDSPFGTFPSKVAKFPDIRWFPYGIHLIVFNFENYDYNLTIDFEGRDRTLWGWYINLDPFWMKWYWMPDTMDVFISARERGLTGLGIVSIRTLRVSSTDNEVHFYPTENPERHAVTQVHYTNDWNDFVDTLIEGIIGGIDNYRRWASAGRGD